ncbi:hypothetical protein E3N88_17584 [Mikania micrantha]|nr:hypothetical protein E3N88_17584 [Mikania micrantha]
MSISFNNNNLKGSLPYFGMLHGMQEILLSNNKFSGVIPPNDFKGLKRLEKLDLSNNYLVGQIPASLTRLPKLKELMLQGNGFEGEIPKFVQGKLTLANFANNHFQGHIPQGLQHFPASLFLGNELCGPPLGECLKKVTSITMIIAVALVVATAVAAVIFAAAILSHHCRHHRLPAEFLNNGSIVLAASANEKGVPSAHNRNKDDLPVNLTFLVDDEERFDLADLLKASAAILGSGLFGSSYKTAMSGRKVMVVKRFKLMNNVGKEEFHEHMKRLSRLRHPNIQPIVAFYYRKDEKLLISNYADNISLAFHLHGKQTDEVQSPDWPTRLKIVKGVVRGLHHLYIKLPSLIVPHGKIPVNALHQSKGNDIDLMDFVNSVVEQEIDDEIFDKEMRGFDKNNEGEMIKLLKIGLSCCEKDASKRMDIEQLLERIEDVKEKDGPEEDFQSAYSSEPDKDGLVNLNCSFHGCETHAISDVLPQGSFIIFLQNEAFEIAL